MIPWYFVVLAYVYGIATCAICFLCFGDEKGHDLRKLSSWFVVVLFGWVIAPFVLLVQLLHLILVWIKKNW